MAMGNRALRQSPTSADAKAPPCSAAGATRRVAPRIYYASPLLVGARDRWQRLLDHVRGLGFDTLLIAPPFATGRSESLLQPASLDRLHPVLAEPQDDAPAFLTWLDRETSARGIRLMLDLPLELSADAEAVAEHPTWFDVGIPDPDAVVDPRRPLRRRSAVPRFDDAELRSQLVELFAGYAQAWAQAGVRGFRCLSPDRLPSDGWHELIRAARSERPSALFCAWTPGLPEREVERLAAAGFDFSFASTAWWDGRATWLVEEYEARRLSAPPIGLVEEPGGRRVADIASGSETEAALRQLRSAAWLGCGYMMVMGFELGATRPLPLAQPQLGEWDALLADPLLDLRTEVAGVNELLKSEPLFANRGQMRQLSSDRAAATVIVRAAAGHPTVADKAAVICLNPDREHATSIDAAAISAAASGLFAPPRAVEHLGGLPVAGNALQLPPSHAALYLAPRAEPKPAPSRAVSPLRAAGAPRVMIERVTPGLPEPELAVKRVAGEPMVVEADIFTDGHELLRAELLWRPQRARDWQRVEMELLGNDRWRAAFPLGEAGKFIYTIEAWRDVFGSWRDEVDKKRAAGVGITAELLEGRHLVERAAAAGESDELRALAKRLASEDTASLLLADATLEAMHRHAPRTQPTRHGHEYAVTADRREALFASWYELFPRSQSGSEDRHGTFDDVIPRLAAIRRMGFDVLYMPPIHPIGRTNRKGRNNSLTPTPDDPGSPYAIGTAEGGHDAVHPDLGGLPAFRRLVKAAADHGMEVALDFAIQCAPDHPWLKQHPEWFAWRPDGSLRYAENPPKKYEDIVNVDFYAEGAIPGLWTALRDVILFWIGEGVRTFRVDNPHTKPLSFWQWMIADVQRAHPDVIFLSEAFTRPAMMRRLAKIGFTQSYTYFTWRNTKAELTDYLTELTQTEMREYYRPHFFVNTPDINPVFLQRGGRAAHQIRAVLATTLSGLWGMYNGFELCEATALPGKEEYLDSEKYQIRAWDWGRPGNIVDDITALNRIRRENPALQTHLGLSFLNCWDDNLIVYRKMTPARDNLIVVAVNLDPSAAHAAMFEAPLWEFGLPDDAMIDVEDLIRGTRTTWIGKMQHLHLDPHQVPYAIWRLSPRAGGG